MYIPATGNENFNFFIALRELSIDCFLFTYILQKTKFGIIIISECLNCQVKKRGSTEQINVINVVFLMEIVQYLILL